MASAFVTLRAMHILFAVLWAGSALFKTSVLHNVARRDARFLTAYLAAGIGATFQTVVAAGTVVFGLLTFVNGDYGPDALGFVPFMMFNIAMLSAFVGLLVTLVWQMPTERKARPLAEADLAGTLEDASVLDLLRAKAARFDSINTVLVAVALVAMVGFRLV